MKNYTIGQRVSSTTRLTKQPKIDQTQVAKVGTNK